MNVHDLEKAICLKQQVGITTYTLRVAEVEALVRVVRLVEAHLTEPSESLRRILLCELREIGAIK